jgi:hypothetical protein
MVEAGKTEAALLFRAPSSKEKPEPRWTAGLPLASVRSTAFRFIQNLIKLAVPRHQANSSAPAGVNFT